jgi:hypothetical protein
MNELAKPSRREFLQTTITSAAALPLLGALNASAEIPSDRSQVFRVNGCPVHDGQLRHVGVDALLHLLVLRKNQIRSYAAALSSAYSW